MKILNLECFDEPDSFRGYFTHDFKEYVEFIITPDSKHLRPMEFSFEIRNYEHFAGVMGKFNPYTRFLINPIEIPELTIIELQKAIKLVP